MTSQTTRHQQIFLWSDLQSHPTPSSQQCLGSVTSLSHLQSINKWCKNNLNPSPSHPSITHISQKAKSVFLRGGYFIKSRSFTLNNTTFLWDEDTHMGFIPRLHSSSSGTGSQSLPQVRMREKKNQFCLCVQMKRGERRKEGRLFFFWLLKCLRYEWDITDGVPVTGCSSHFCWGSEIFISAGASLEKCLTHTSSLSRTLWLSLSLFLCAVYWGTNEIQCVWVSVILWGSWKKKNKEIKSHLVLFHVLYSM